MPLLECPHCGQQYNPLYIQYCARCGQAVPDEKGKLPKSGPMDGMGARGGVHLATLKGDASAPPPAPEPAAPSTPSRPSHAVEDMVLEYRNRLNQAPEDHDVRYSLALAYIYAHQWERAEAELLLVAEGMPGFADAHARLAVCRARSGRVPEALEAAREALEINPDSARYRHLVERLEQAVSDAADQP